MTIYKYQCPFEDDFVLFMPKGAIPIHFGNQRGVACLWALVNPKAPVKKYVFRMAGTGHPIGQFGVEEYIGTAQFAEGELIFHLFQVN